jgi:hypothetical protein
MRPAFCISVASGVRIVGERDLPRETLDRDRHLV